MERQIKEFAKIREDYINSQIVIINDEIKQLQAKITNGTDVERLTEKFNRKLMAAIVDEEFYEQVLDEPLERSVGVTVGRISQINTGEVNIVDLKYNDKPVDLVYLTEESIDKIVQRLPLNSSYTDKHSMDYTITQANNVLQRTKMTQNEVRKLLEDKSLLSRIRYTNKLLDIFTAESIVDRLTVFMHGRYLVVESKIKRDLVRQVEEYLCLFKTIVKSQPFYVSRLVWNGLPGGNNTITSEMINTEVNCLYRELVIRQIHLEFGLTIEDFNTSTAKHALLVECGEQIRLLEQKKRDLHNL